MRQGFRVLARASDDIDLSSGGLGTAIASLQSRRDVMRSTVQAALEGLRITATQKDKVIPVYMKQFALTAEESSWVYDNVVRSWALDGKPTAASDASNITGDPLLTAPALAAAAEAFRPSPTSPARHAGRPVTAVPLDYACATRGTTNTTIGAFE